MLFDYFDKISQKKLKVIHKPQHIDKIGSLLEGKIGGILKKADDRGKLPGLIEELELGSLLERDVKVLSGGELQRVAIAAAMSRAADVYVFDEPSSHLDIYQRIRVARTIRTLVDEGKSVLVAEHDLAMLDYLSDEVYLVYGQPSSYGVVSHGHPTRSGINDYLTGFLADENMRFRDEPIRFHVRPPRETSVETPAKLEWPRISKVLGNFSVDVDPGCMFVGDIVGIVGPNGIGKTTFMKELVEYYSKTSMNEFIVSYKPQYISSDYGGSVEELLTAAADDYSSALFTDVVIRPLSINKLLERRIKELSGGELQRVAIAACLGKKAQVYQ